jgi:hypothetical protein
MPPDGPRGRQRRRMRPAGTSMRAATRAAGTATPDHGSTWQPSATDARSGVYVAE